MDVASGDRLIVAAIVLVESDDSVGDAVAHCTPDSDCDDDTVSHAVAVVVA